ncbi:MAG: ribonuclease Y [Oscillospiraceae bacterium]|jgi:ribonuclease Y|nr:ribonuclease Y [Oscillospiraceae bacterium]
MPDSVWFYIIDIVILIIMTVIGFFLGVTYRKRFSEREIQSAEEKAKKIINDSIKAAEGKKREALLEAKEEIHKNRSEYEQEEKERRAEVQKQEKRVQQKEESLQQKEESLQQKEESLWQKETTLDNKTEALEKKSEQLTDKLAGLDKTREEIEDIKRGQLETLERISGYTVEEAKNYLIKNLESAVTHEAAMKIKDIETRYREEADEKARELISLAIQRCASDHVAEVTVSVVPLPNDEMKGRIIGREGRNIRALETLTGVDLIIDDTPEAITLSGFDPVRREVARITLEKLILDGRIHPARIEETVEKAKREVDAVIKSEGERATFETGVHGLNPEVVKLLGRMRYRTSYGQNVLNHSIEVARIAGLLASELGVDVMLAKRAGLLHDIGKSIDHEVEGSHVTIGVDIAKKFKESEAVIHAIHAHHGDVEAKTVIACIVQASDTISAARPGARRENIESYVKRLEKLESISKSFKGVDSSYAIQAGREIRIIVKPEEISEDEMIILAREIANKIESDMEYPGQIKVNLIRETKAVEYAR